MTIYVIAIAYFSCERVSQKNVKFSNIMKLTTINYICYTVRSIVNIDMTEIKLAIYKIITKCGS